MQAISTESAKQTIESLLIELNLSPHYKGYHYCLSALLLCLEDIHYLSGQITKTLYAKIGAQYNVSAAAVEAGIRHAVAAIWTRTTPPRWIGFLASAPASALPTRCFSAC